MPIHKKHVVVFTCACMPSDSFEELGGTPMLCCRCWNLLRHNHQFIIVLTGTHILLYWLDFAIGMAITTRTEFQDAACMSTVGCKMNDSIASIGSVAQLDDNVMLCARFVPSMVYIESSDKVTSSSDTIAPETRCASNACCVLCCTGAAVALIGHMFMDECALCMSCSKANTRNFSSIFICRTLSCRTYHVAPTLSGRCRCRSCAHSHSAIIAAL